MSQIYINTLHSSPGYTEFSLFPLSFTNSSYKFDILKKSSYYNKKLLLHRSFI